MQLPRVINGMRLRIVENLAMKNFWVEKRGFLGWWPVSIHFTLDEAKKRKAELEASGADRRVVG